MNRVLKLYPSIARPLGTPEGLGNAGGLSGSRLWRYQAGLGTLVARAWPSDGPPLALLETIHGWLAESALLAFVPVPVRGLDGRTLYEESGCFWEVTPWMPGGAETDRLPTHGQVRAGFEALAAFHQRLACHATRARSPGLQARRREVEWLLNDGLAVFRSTIDLQPGSRLAELARRWIEAASVEAPKILHSLQLEADRVIACQPCLRDVRPDHLLFTGDRLTGLVDFGAMGYETVAADLARLASEWLGRDRSLRALAFDAYHAIRPISAEETALIEVFEWSSALLGASHWIRWHFLEGRRFEDPSAVERGLEKGLDRLHPIKMIP